MIGQRIGRLLVLEQTYRYFPRADRPSPSRKIYFRCLCDCGKEIETAKSNLVNGHTSSCGCLAKEVVGARYRKHGESRVLTPEYRCWRSIKNRCYNPKYKQYESYGGRGIRVCDRWLESFEHFLLDMGRRPTAKHSIGRIKNDCDYSPDNCEWQTDEEQRKNRQSTIWIEVDGVRKTLIDWLADLKLSRSTYEWRRNKGKSERESLGL